MLPQRDAFPLERWLKETPSTLKMLQAIAIVALCQVGGRVDLGRRKSSDPSSHNSFSYEVLFKGQKGNLTASVSMTLHESLLINGQALFSISNVMVKKGNGSYQAWDGTPPTSWSDEALSASSLFGLSQKSCFPGQKLAVSKNFPMIWFGFGDTVLFCQSGSIEYVKESHSIAGQVRIFALGKEAVYKVFARFDPRTGRPLTVKIGDSQNIGSSLIESGISLTIQASDIK